ncbi:MAG: PASTA domain-containing protein, partial [Egibacteraceae bacterium]
AVAAIQDAGLAVGSRDEERSDDADAGEVIAADPEPGTQLEEGERVDYAVAGGPATVVIPDVRGQSRDAAEQALREDCGDPPCLSITVERSFDDDVDQGDAIGTDPGDGTRVEYGSTVVLVISRGPEPEPEPEPTEEEPPPPEEPPPTDAPTELPTDAATEQTQGG